MTTTPNPGPFLGDGRLKANIFQLTGCYLYWWFQRLRHNNQTEDNSVGSFFAKMQFYTSILVPLFILTGWTEYKIFHVSPNDYHAYHVVGCVLILILVDKFVLLKAKLLIKKFESIENRMYYDSIVVVYISITIVLIVLTAFYFPRQINS